MENFTKEQINKAMDALPYEIHKILFGTNIERKVQKLGFEAGLLIEQLKTLNTLVNYAIMNLVSRKDIAPVLEKEFALPTIEAQELSSGIARDVFSSIEAIEAQVKKEKEMYETTTQPKTAATEKTKQESNEIPTDLVTTPEPTRTWGKTLDVAPDNLPTAEAEEPESFLPPIPPKNIQVEPTETPAHPFEEKMKRVFTAGEQSMGELTLEPSPKNIPQENLVIPAAPRPAATPTPAPNTASPRQDLYREPIE